MPQFTPVFTAQQLNEELVGRCYFLAPEIEVYVKNLIRIVGEQDDKIRQLDQRVLQLVNALPLA